MCFDSGVLAKLESEDEKNLDRDKLCDKEKQTTPIRQKKTFTRFRKREYPSLTQRFSKLTEEDTFDMDSDSRASTPSAEFSDVPDSPGLEDEEKNGSFFDNLPLDNDLNNLPKVSTKKEYSTLLHYIFV